MADLASVTEFEIHVYRADNTLSFIMKVNASAPHDAKLHALRMLDAGHAYAVIWQGLIEVATVHRDKPN